MKHTVMFDLLRDNTKIQEILQSIFYRKQKVLLFMKSCQNLPDDVIRKIYEEYLQPDMLYEDLVNTLSMLSSKCLDTTQLKIFIPKILQNKIFLEHLLRKDSLFNDIYTNHIIKKTNTYVRSDSIIDSMAMEWLAYLYH